MSDCKKSADYLLSSASEPRIFAAVAKENPSKEDGLVEKSKCREILSRNYLIIVTLLCIVVGLGGGIGLRAANASAEVMIWVGMPGEIFIRMLKMCIIPLIVSNIMIVTAKMEPRSHGKISLFTLIYILCGNNISSLIGAVLSVIIRPGSQVAFGRSVGSMKADQSIGLSTSDIFADLVRNLLPDNLFQSSMFSVTTVKTSENVSLPNNASELVWNRALKLSQNTNILGIIMCSVIFGLAVGHFRRSNTISLEEKRKVAFFIDFFEALGLLVLKILHVLLKFLPFGLTSLMVNSIATVRNLESMLGNLGLFVATVLVAVLIWQLVVCQLLYLIFLRRSPHSYYIRLMKAWLTAFSTTSSMAALPSLYIACDEKKIDNAISRFVIPLCISCNATGSAAFITVSVIFIAQLNGIYLAFGQVLATAFLTGFSVMALPSVPSASIVTIVIVLEALRIPTDLVSLIFTTEFILDRFRTTTNVISHAYCAAIIDKLYRGELQVTLNSTTTMNRSAQSTSAQTAVQLNEISSSL